MEALFGGFATRAAGPLAVFLGYTALFAALALAGYVTAHLAGRPHLMWASLVAIIYILLTATFQATRDAIVAHEAGIGALAPIDFVQLTVTDVLALTGAVAGGWLAERFQVSA
jgi:hypothetical protein